MTIRFDGGTDPVWTDLLMRLGALGARGVLVEQDEAGGIDLALKADAFFVRMESEEAASSAATTADASRLRLVLEGARAYALSDTASVRRSFELGLRHDGGAAETGAGLERGGGVTFADATSGFSLEAKARMLAAHADTDSEEWGMSATARLDPGERRRGLSLTPHRRPLRARPSGCGAPSARRRSHRAPGSRRRGASRPRRATGSRSPADASPSRPTSASGLAMAERATGASAAWTAHHGCAEPLRAPVGQPDCRANLAPGREAPDGEPALVLCVGRIAKRMEPDPPARPGYGLGDDEHHRVGGRRDGSEAGRHRRRQGRSPGGGKRHASQYDDQQPWTSQEQAAQRRARIEPRARVRTDTPAASHRAAMPHRA